MLEKSRPEAASGERATIFRATAPANGFVADLRRAEAEAEIICF